MTKTFGKMHESKSVRGKIYDRKFTRRWKHSEEKVTFSEKDSWIFINYYEQIAHIIFSVWVSLRIFRKIFFGFVKIWRKMLFKNWSWIFLYIFLKGIMTGKIDKIFEIFSNWRLCFWKKMQNVNNIFSIYRKKNK